MLARSADSRRVVGAVAGQTAVVRRRLRGREVDEPGLTRVVDEHVVPAQVPMRNARVALAIMAKPPDAAFWNEVSKTKWIDDHRMYLVNVGAPGRAPAAQGAGRAAARPYKSIIEDKTVPDRFYREEGTVVRVAKVQSFAAGYITHELSTNGRR